MTSDSKPWFYPRMVGACRSLHVLSAWSVDSRFNAMLGLLALRNELLRVQASTKCVWVPRFPKLKTGEATLSP